LSENPLLSILSHFENLDDPRSEHGRRHKLVDILAISIVSVICGANNWPEVQLFGEAKSTWLATFLELPHGIPTHYTFRRVFARLDPDQLRRSFMSWVGAIHDMQADQICVDGKEVRRSHDGWLGKEAIQMVSAWAQEHHLVLGQVKVKEGSNEIEAIPRLLKMLDLAGCVVTIDAIGCQKSITKLITERDGDYALAVKQNQGRLYKDIKALFDEIDHPDMAFIEHDHYKRTEKGHGRIETRECWILTDELCLDYLRDREAWHGVQSVVMVKSKRTIDGTASEEQIRYYISSLPGDAKHLLSVVRGHWSIENNLHWVLDIAFREDESRLRKGNGAENMAILRQLVLNLLKQETTFNGSIKAKRLRAGWVHEYLLKILSLG
jgi:predicted transposase YbfD/YdcC